MAEKIFVGGLSWDTDHKRLHDFFAQYGEIVKAKVVMDDRTGRSRGFGFVTFSRPEEARKATSLNGSILDGRKLRVDYARKPSSGNGSEK